MVAFNKFDQFVQDLANKVHNLGSDTLKIMLTDVAPVRTNTVKANISEIPAGNGYVTGGNQATQISSTQTSGLETLKLNNVLFTASGGAISQFRYGVLYNATAAGGPLIAWYDFGQEINLTVSQIMSINFDPTNGTLTIQ